MGMSVQTASAWSDKGHLVPLGDHSWSCDPAEGWCQKSVDPNDPNATIGDKVLSNYPDGRGVVQGIIIEIGPASQDPTGGQGGDDSQASVIRVVNDATGVVDQIVTSGN